MGNQDIQYDQNNLNNHIEEILKKMTIEEKARLVCGESFFCISGIPSMNIKGLQLLDGGTGMNYEQLIGDIFTKYQEMELSEEDIELIASHTKTELRRVIEYYFAPDKLTDRERKLRRIAHAELERRFRKNTRSSKASFVYHAMEEEERNMMSPACFPTGMLLGATWNKEILHMVGQALGREARAHGVHMLLGTPNINIHRDPLNGRLFEGFSEDPYLVSALAPELVKGVQEEGVAANVKHFAANNQETNRQGIDETISERALNEIYFPGFRACVEEAQPATLMSAYNQINGTACTENTWLLKENLRENWGFQGMVVSDWGAVYHPIEALKAGTDVNMPGPVDTAPVLEAIENGSLTEEELDVNVRRILAVILNYNHPPVYDESCQYIMDRSKQAAYRAACEGIVLLKNENQIFPFAQGYAKGGSSDSAFSDVAESSGNVARVILCGSGALRLYDCGTGSAGITTDKTSGIYEGLAENGIPVEVGIPIDWASIQSATYICVARVGGMEGNDRRDLKLNEDDRQILDKLVQMKKVCPKIKLGLILNVCGPVELNDWEKELDGIFCIFLPGMEGGRAMADILCGRVNPSGKLPVTFPKTYKDTPTYLNFPGDGYHVCYGEGIYVGYRHYDKRLIEPLYPFGHGLSYCNFQITNIRVSIEEQGLDLVSSEGEIQSTRLPVFTDQIKVSVDVENLGPQIYGEAAEVVQLYIRDEVSTLSKPMKECKAFQKVRLAYKEKTTVTFTLTRKDFASYDEDLHTWTVEEGAYHILVGSSSRRIMCSKRIYLKTKSPYSYSIYSTIKDLYENRITREHMLELWEKLQLDPAYIHEKYEYQSNMKLFELLHFLLKGEKPDQEAIDEFNYRVGAILRV